MVRDLPVDEVGSLVGVANLERDVFDDTVTGNEIFVCGVGCEDRVEDCGDIEEFVDIPWNSSECIGIPADKDNPDI